jgi:hypothetical protein
MSAAQRPRKLFSYVVDHDYGYAPNPSGGYCTLCQCKFSHNGRHKNIVESAQEGDWIVGTGGVDETKSSGHGSIIYAMEVQEILALKDYLKDPRFASRKDTSPASHAPWRRALISRRFYYFGRKALRIPARFQAFPNPDPKGQPRKFTLPKKFAGFKANFPEQFIAEFERWISKFKSGKSGKTCGSVPPNPSKRCSPT